MKKIRTPYGRIHLALCVTGSFVYLSNVPSSLAWSKTDLEVLNC